MKAMRHPLFLAVICFILVSLQSCKYEEEEPTPAIRYYQFTAQDKLWFNYKVADSLIFENSTGKQQVYIVIEINEKIKEGAGYSSFGFFGRGNASYYYDGIKIDFKRLDTLEYNSIEFRRTLPQSATNGYPSTGNGEFQLGGFWENYNGGFKFGGITGNINVSSQQLSLQNSSQLIIRGNTYNKVIAIIPDQPNGPILGNRKPYINTLYYDQKAGIVRMVSTTNEVWDRVP